MNERAIPNLCLGAMLLMLSASISMATGIWNVRGAAPRATPTTIARVTAAAFIAWEPSLETALERAKATGKPILVDFYTDWCPACKTMSQTYAAPEVVAIAGNVVSVKVNAEHRSDLAAQYGVTSYPTIMALNSDGSVYNSFVGAYSPAEFAQWLRGTFPSAVPA